MKSKIITITFSALAGATASILILIPLIVSDLLDEPVILRSEFVIRYTQEGKIERAFISYCSYEEYFAAIAKESGFIITVDPMPKRSVSMSLTNINWEAAILFTANTDYEVTKVAEKKYHVKMRPQK